MLIVWNILNFSVCQDTPWTPTTTPHSNTSPLPFFSLSEFYWVPKLLEWNSFKSEDFSSYYSGRKHLTPSRTNEYLLSIMQIPLCSHVTANGRNVAVWATPPAQNLKLYTAVSMQIYLSKLMGWHCGMIVNISGQNLICHWKAVPLQAWTDPESYRMLRLPDLKTIGIRRW
jgi:hypothetical protein